MNEYSKSTIWLVMITVIIILFIIIGGYFSRGSYAVGAELIIIICAPYIISRWYKSEKQEYLYRKTLMDGLNHGKEKK